MLLPFRRSSIRFLFVLFFHEVLNRAGGRSGWGGGLRPTKTPPPTRCKRTCFSFFVNGKRLSQGPHFSIQFSINFRSIFDQFSNYDLHFDELHLAYVGQCYFYNGYVNRGLLDAIPLPRTTPDNHENYHQCVCERKVIHCAANALPRTIQHLRGQPRNFETA